MTVAPTLNVIGLISGTSCDGIDAALCEISCNEVHADVKVIRFLTRPYPPWLRNDLFRIFEGSFDVGHIGRLHHAIGRELAQAAKDVCAAADFPTSRVDLVGSHGQTVGHAPSGTGDPPIPWTLQLGEPAWIREAFECRVVSNFRAADIAAGGEGAPLTPLPDYLLFRADDRNRLVLNIGGIANVTVLPRGCVRDDVTGFDTGPGNMIVDALVRAETNGAETCDRNGMLSGKGHVCQPLLQELLDHPFFRMSPPKSSGRLQFGEWYAKDLRERARKRGLSFEDLVATTLALTARTICGAIENFVEPRPEEVLLCGGGARHPLLRTWIAEGLPFARVTTTDDYGVPIDAREAICFALLAYESFLGRPGNLPRVTGAKRAVVLGEMSTE